MVDRIIDPIGGFMLSIYPSLPSVSSFAYSLLDFPEKYQMLTCIVEVLPQPTQLRVAYNFLPEKNNTFFRRMKNDLE